MKKFSSIKKSILAFLLICSALSARAKDSESAGFLSLKLNANLVLNESIGYLYGSLGYGQNILIKEKYFGFFAGYINTILDGSPIYKQEDDEPLKNPADQSSSPTGSPTYNQKKEKSRYNSTVALLNAFFLEFKYGYEFLRQNTFSFGLDTSLGFGFVGTRPGFSNAIGGFGKMKATSALSAILQAGLQHHNQFRTINHIIDYLHFGPYVHVGIRYYL